MALGRLGYPGVLSLSRLASNEGPQRPCEDRLDELFVFWDCDLARRSKLPLPMGENRLRWRRVLPMRPQVVMRLGEHSFVQGLPPRGLYELRPDG